MSKKNDNIKDLINEFKVEQKRFKEEQNKLIKEQKDFEEKQSIINKQVAEQNKRNKRGILLVLSISLIFSGITSALSYTLGASSVQFTPRDSNWNVSNTQEAIDNLFDSVGSALVGSVYSYMGVITPPGYLACDGSVYNIDDYPRLANHINVNFGSVNHFGGDGETTFAVPDLRGEFLRGTGTNSHTNTLNGITYNEGSGAAVGVHQTATTHPYIRSYATNGRTFAPVDTASNSETGTALTNLDSRASKSGRYYGDIGSVSTTYNASSEGNDAYTSRPTNTSVLYIIKY